MIKLRIIGILMLLGCTAAFSQNLSNKGREFWVGYGHHQFFENGSNSQQMVLYLSAEQTANVTVSINGTSYSQTYVVAANSVISTSVLPKSGAFDCRLFSTPSTGFVGTLSEGTSDRGIHIVSDVPIVAYAHIYGSASSGATMLMPTETWGYSYTSVNSKQLYGTDCFSWMYIIGKENNTRVRITPSNPSRAGKPANVPFEITLNKGQIYQLLGALSSGSTGYELTGTKVKSIANASGECYPIAVFSGSSRTQNPANCGSGGGDNDIQQLFPSQAWGRRYLTAPTSASTSAAVNQTNSYKILVTDPATEVKRNGVVLTGLINSTYYLFESSEAEYITADKPIMVAQFMTGGNCSAGGLGDPEMIYISPIEQGIKRIGFYRNTQQAITVNYLTLIIPSNGVNSLTIDGSSSYTYSYDHPGLPGYTVIIKKWNAAQAQCIVQSDSAFTAITYGLGSVESYGFNAGTLIKNLNVIGSVQNTLANLIPTTTINQTTCRKTPAEISMYVAYQPTSMVWNLSTLPVLTPNADVTVSSPVPSNTLVQNGVTYYKYTLPGTYTFTDTGTFIIPVRNTHPSIDNCNNSELVNFTILVKQAPVTDFTTQHTGCQMDTVHFNSPAITGSFNVVDWAWTYADMSTASIQNPLKLFTTPGTQNVNLKIITSEGCIGDTTKSINIFARPSAAFTANPISICQGSTVNFAGTSSYGGSAPVNAWYWDFGNNTNVTATTNTGQSATYNNFGSFTVKHVVKVSPTCISDTITKLINVYAKPNIQFNFPAGCLPANGIVQFNNNTATPDAQGITHAWTFGDPNANAGNPNTSSLQSPSHNFPVGSYTINYSATTVNGCMKDTTFNTSFNVRAELSYASLPSVCESVNGTIPVLGGTVLNGVTGTYVYKGTATDASGNFRPSLAGPGTHTIWYVFTSGGGCKDSVSTTIKVHPKPVANFTVTPDICLNQIATISDLSSIPSGNITGRNWNFGDNSSSSTTSNAPFTKSYAAYNNYVIKLVAISDSSCVSDTFSKTIAVHPLPVPNFTLPAFVCMPNGNAQFTNTSSTADNAALNYQWNFGDLGTSTQQNPNHIYTAFGPFNVKLTATSNFGCTKDTTKVLNAFFDKPLALFAVQPDTLCQGVNNVFSDFSSAPNSTVQSWNWNFGDGQTSTVANPVKKYNNPGNYSVTLTVKNAQGCTSDPFKDTVVVYLQPVINAGSSFIVPIGTLITFNATANDSTQLDFMWTPSANFSDPTKLRPSIVAMNNQTYTLTAIGDGNCTATDTMSVKILKPVVVPNAFSPNGDGINDTWMIPNLADYPGCKVEVYNRYGQVIYQSNGYGTPWNGTYKGASLPFATYYYIITLKNGFAPVTGSVTIVK